MYYCFYVGDWSFHAPVGEWETPDESADADPRTDMSLKEALETLNQELDENANEYLDSKTASYGFDSYFIGWNYLSDKPAQKTL